MTATAFWGDRLGRLALQTAAMAALSVFLLATGTQPGVLTIVLIVWTLLFLGMQTADYLSCRARLRELEAILDGLDQKYLFPECIPKPKSAYERRLNELMRRSGKAMIEAVSVARAAQRDYREYIESWVHEIKAPITAAQLICRNAAPEIRRKLTGELAQIDNHVERALFYARAESTDRDFLIRSTSLAEIAAQAIERHRALLIQNGVRIETEGLDCTVFTDGKWVGFMLGQLLQNAVRYRGDDPAVTLTGWQLGRQVQLAVRDNGIGIPSHELPRVFERGFTGSNGRARGGATGMGLYLCRRLAAALEIGVQIQSEEGQGTSVTLTFPAKDTLSKV